MLIAVNESTAFTANLIYTALENATGKS